MGGTFFNVNTIRVLWFDTESQKLLISSAQMRRKECMSFGLDKGIVGLCAKRQQVMHIANISQHPYVDAAADGLQRTGRPVGSHAAMLCGPLLIDSDEAVGHDGSNLLGVVQLLERKKKATGAAAEASGQS